MMFTPTKAEVVWASRMKMVRVSVVLTGLIDLSGCEPGTEKSTHQTVSDASITSAVQAKLTQDRLSNVPRIDVDTEHGVVNLSGMVQTDAQRVEAALLAQEVEGVTRVNNDLQLQR